MGNKAAGSHTPARDLWYGTDMPTYRWDADKDRLLRRTRGVSFADVVYQIEHGGLLDTIDHPNQERYPGQQMFIIRIRDYAYQVPFDQTGSEIFLRTVYPSRKAVRNYLQPTGEDNGHPE